MSSEPIADNKLTIKAHPASPAIDHYCLPLFRGLGSASPLADLVGLDFAKGPSPLQRPSLLRMAAVS